MPFADSFFRHAPTTPRLARSLRHLAREIDAAWPNRSTTSDGWLGDDAHLLRVSDHNPDADGIVHALDATVFGERAATVVAGACAHPSTHYVIHDRLIYQRRHAFEPWPYDGPDPHVSHVHISIRHTRKARRSRARWLDV